MEEKKEKSIVEVIKETWESEHIKHIRLGMAIAKLRDAYYYKDLIAFLKGNDETHGSMYFYLLKPLYDEYGYKKVNDILIELDSEEANNE